MEKKRLINTMLILLVAITLVGSIALVVVMKFTGDAAAEGNNIDKIIKQVVSMDEITTNLQDDGYIRTSFTIQTDSKKAKEELEKRNFQVKNIIIEELSEMKASDFKGKKGITALEKKIQTEINKLMQKGSVTQVYITSFVLQ